MVSPVRISEMDLYLSGKVALLAEHPIAGCWECFRTRPGRVRGDGASAQKNVNGSHNERHRCSHSALPHCLALVARARLDVGIRGADELAIHGKRGIDRRLAVRQLTGSATGHPANVQLAEEADTHSPIRREKH